MVISWSPLPTALEAMIGRPFRVRISGFVISGTCSPGLTWLTHCCWLASESATETPSTK